MMRLSLAMADRCDTVLRLGGFCLGADEEVVRIRSRGGVAYYSLAHLPEKVAEELQRPIKPTTKSIDVPIDVRQDSAT